MIFPKSESKNNNSNNRSHPFGKLTVPKILYHRKDMMANLEKTDTNEYFTKLSCHVHTNIPQ